MTVARPDHWLWDFWLADDGRTHHLFYLHAPKSLGNPDLRHRNARIGHATSTDLRSWTHHAPVFDAGPPGAFDDTANWTGSVARGPDGRWYLYYTGSHFLSAAANTNIETIGVAVSDDLFTWTKRPGPVCRADSAWYETLGTSSWPEEAWRDPWVFPDADGKTWHMFITGRANHGDDSRRGVVGHAVSTDMVNWQVRPPLSAPDVDFAHLEVLQTATIAGRNYLLFSCDTPRLAGRLSGQMGGIWYLPVTDFSGPFDIGTARLLAPQRLYAGRLVQQRDGQWALMGFNNGPPFDGSISDPIPLEVGPDGTLAINEEASA